MAKHRKLNGDTSADDTTLRAVVKDDLAFMEELTERFKEEYDASKGQEPWYAMAMFDDVVSKTLEAFDEGDAKHKLRNVNHSKGASQKDSIPRGIKPEDHFRAWLIILYNTFSSLDWTLPDKNTNPVILQQFWIHIRDAEKKDEKKDANKEEKKWVVGLELFFAIIIMAEKVSWMKTDCRNGSND